MTTQTTPAAGERIVIYQERATRLESWAALVCEYLEDRHKQAPCEINGAGLMLDIYKSLPAHQHAAPAPVPAERADESLADFLKRGAEEMERETAHLPRPIAGIHVSQEGQAIEITLDTSKADYSDWIQGEGADIGLHRDQETNKVTGARLPLYAKTLVIGGTVLPTMRFNLETGEVIPPAASPQVQGERELPLWITELLDKSYNAEGEIVYSVNRYDDESATGNPRFSLSMYELKNALETLRLRWPASPAAARLEEVEMKYQWASKERQDYYDQLIALRSTVARLTSQLQGVQGALADAGNVPAFREDGDYGASVRQVVEERDQFHARAEHLETWSGLMEVLDKHYPADVFDGSSGDPGARIVVLIRQLAAAQERVAVLTRENERLSTKLRRWENDPLEPQDANPIDTIAATRGWLPLVPGERMTVHYNQIGYVIQREPFSIPSPGGLEVVVGGDSVMLSDGWWAIWRCGYWADTRHIEKYNFRGTFEGDVYLKLPSNPSALGPPAAAAESTQENDNANRS